MNFRFKTTVAESNLFYHSFSQLWLNVMTLKLILGPLGRSTHKIFGSIRVLRCTSHGVVMIWRYWPLLKVGRSSMWLTIPMDKWTVCRQVHLVLHIVYRTWSRGGSVTVQLWLRSVCLRTEPYCFGVIFLSQKHVPLRGKIKLFILSDLLPFARKWKEFSGF